MCENDKINIKNTKQLMLSIQYSIESSSANSKPLRILNMMLHKISAL